MPSKKVEAGQGRGDADGDGGAGARDVEAVADGVGLWLTPAGRVETDAVGEGVPEGDGVGVCVPVGDGVGDGVPEGDGVTDAVGEGVGEGATHCSAELEPVCSVMVPLPQGTHVTLTPPSEYESSAHGAHTPFSTPSPAAQSGKQSFWEVDRLPSVE